MSQYSGKCDFADHIEIHGVDNVLKSNIYIGNELLPLRIDSPKDLIPYYPRLVVTAGLTDGVGEIRLAKESYVDTEERVHLEWYYKDAERDYKRCKRNKKPVDTILELNEHDRYNAEAKTEIRKRLIENHGKASCIDDIHLEMSDWYRKRLYDEMVAAGWKAWEAYYWVYKDMPRMESMESLLRDL